MHIKKNNNYTTKKIHIIGGQWRGKKITIKNTPCLRPTLNQIKEKLFNWLTPSTISGSHCLDCFAGSGSLGLEALSRHAHAVIFLEKNKTLCTKLQKVIQSLRPPVDKQQARIITTNTNKWLNQTNNKYFITPFNIVFLDPPFNKITYITKCIQLLEEKQYLTKNSYIYIETKNITQISITFNIPKNWELYRQTHTKTIACYLYQRKL